VKGVGPARADALGKEGVRTVEDLLYRFPLRYEDRRSFTPIADLREGMRTAVAGTIAVAGLRRARRVSLFEVRLEDGSGRLKALWFNQPFLQDVLTRGRRVILFGTVEKDEYGGARVMMSSPQHELAGEEDTSGVHVGRVVPIYEKAGGLSGQMLRRVLAQLAEQLPAELPDPLPAAVRERLGVIGRADALRAIHRPPDDADVALLNRARGPAYERLILEELFLFQLGLARRHEGAKERRKDAVFEVNDRVRDAVKRILPFRLTGAQKRVLREIAADLTSPQPMRRLVQGDVGSGKTMIALLAMVIAVESGYQAAFMAPTEILAEQHFLTFKRLLARCPYTVELVTAAAQTKRAARSAVRERLVDGTTKIAVGTHALIQPDVAFHRLGLAIVDEQHRFGVLQRDELARKGRGDLDVLVLTATPIPRSLALTAYGDLDLSVVDERPPGRTPIVTRRQPASDRRAAVDRVRAEIERGRQAYVVYPLVSESEKLEDIRAATEMAEEWARALPGVNVGLLHGKLKSAEKEQVMAAFAGGAVQVLVATTVIEVGVDVPNATIMVIEHAERFGLSQLHQLRGRVGRGAGASSCLLVSHGRLSDEAKARLDVMVQTDDGFVIAERDLELRGPGDFFGTRQWGLPPFRAARLIRDRDLLEKARAEALRFVSQGAPEDRAALARFLDEGGWARRFGLARVG
jgi:ATP-dependent DNA helicase RecG